MRPKGRWVWAPVAVLILISAWSPMPSEAATKTPACGEVSPRPILQDADWKLINPSLNYSDYTLFYVQPFVTRQGSDYVMYLTMQRNSTSGIYRGTSPDGANWNISSTPVLRTGPNGSWDGAVVFSAKVVWNGTGYLMYYVGDGGNTTTFRQIGAAFSSDGVHWVKSAHNPVITHGPGTYDQRYTRGPSVIFDSGTYKMWYWGTAPPNATVPFQSSIDYATSTDGVHWTKYPGNPLFLGFMYADSSTSAQLPSVVKVNGTYLMAFQGYTNDFGLATSTDGIHWKFDNQTDVLLNTSGWHSGSIGDPSLLVDGRRVLLWYDGGDNGTRKSPYVGGIGFASCGILLAQIPVVTTTSVTSTATVTQSTVSTLISTSTVQTTAVQTVTSSVGAPLTEVATAGVVGFAAAVALAVGMLLMRTRSHPRSST